MMFFFQSLAQKFRHRRLIFHYENSHVRLLLNRSYRARAVDDQRISENCRFRPRARYALQTVLRYLQDNFSQAIPED